MLFNNKKKKRLRKFYHLTQSDQNDIAIITDMCKRTFLHNFTSLPIEKGMRH